MNYEGVHVKIQELIESKEEFARLKAAAKNAGVDHSAIQKVIRQVASENGLVAKTDPPTFTKNGVTFRTFFSPSAKNQDEMYADRKKFTAAGKKAIDEILKDFSDSELNVEVVSKQPWSEGHDFKIRVLFK